MLIVINLNNTEIKHKQNSPLPFFPKQSMTQSFIDILRIFHMHMHMLMHVNQNWNSIIQIILYVPWKNFHIRTYPKYLVFIPLYDYILTDLSNH